MSVKYTGVLHRKHCAHTYVYVDRVHALKGKAEKSDCAKDKKV